MRNSSRDFHLKKKEPQKILGISAESEAERISKGLRRFQLKSKVKNLGRFQRSQLRRKSRTSEGSETSAVESSQEPQRVLEISAEKRSKKLRGFLKFQLKSEVTNLGRHHSFSAC